ncbi:MAG: hypothetical protein H0U71_06925 [Gammaproteobacteria bacterium]|nr:hypothetical protein [Gammaproteobacteria bacterium]
MKKFISLLILFSALNVHANSIDLTGHYRCQGNDFLNHSTFDEPTVVTKTGETYLFTWINKNLVFYGTAILQDNVISSVFWTPTHLNAPGVVTYRVLPNGDLKGKWSIKDSRMVGDEYCTKLK